MEATAEFLPDNPAKWTPGQRARNERMSAFLRVLRAEGIIIRACEVSGVDESTVWRWREQYPTFSEAVHTFMTGTRQQRIEENMYRIATSTDPKQANASVKAGEMMLKALDPATYVATLKQETTITINQQVQVIHTVRDDLRARQLERLKQLKTIDAESASALLSQSDSTGQGEDQ